MIERNAMALAMRRSNSAVLILAGNVLPFSMPRSMPEREPWTQARLSSGGPDDYLLWATVAPHCSSGNKGYNQRCETLHNQTG